MVSFVVRSIPLSGIEFTPLVDGRLHQLVIHHGSSAGCYLYVHASDHSDAYWRSIIDSLIQASRSAALP
eukprot:7589694-Prorocentrum_lima.AAC.1